MNSALRHIWLCADDYGISPGVNTPWAGAGLPDLQERTKRKGLQLALEPLNGQGIAGYVPGP